ncbi:unnamed protein product [Lactuca virosa]|uniref:Uncharacterized protein n=1 Tax=Lactuca virosa TaxID=75947 RepID=A0AAU9P1E0_9ASTR|nr:unnamed protein product [Lactuca virosa]
MVRENVNHKLEELKVDVSKDLRELDNKYSSLLEKVDIIADGVTTFVKTHQSFDHKFDEKATAAVTSFGKLTTLLEELKGIVSKSSSSSIFTPEFLDQKFRYFEATIQKMLAPLSQFVTILPTNASPVITGVQGGEKEGVGKGANVCEKTNEETKVVGKVFKTQIPTTKPIFSKAEPVIATTVTTRPITKGIVIGSTGEGEVVRNLRKLQQLQTEGKQFLVEKMKEERNAEIEAEMEKQSHIQGILMLRASDPPRMNKGDPTRLHSYENIEARVA